MNGAGCYDALSYPRRCSQTAKTCCYMRLFSEFLVNGREQLISRQTRNIEPDNARRRGLNVGGSYIHPCAEGVNARRLDASLENLGSNALKRVKKIRKVKSIQTILLLSLSDRTHDQWS